MPHHVLARRAAPACATLLLALSGCWLDRALGNGNGDAGHVDGVSANFYRKGSTSVASLPSGDTATLRAIAWNIGFIHREVRDSYASAADARRFAWTSSDSTVATIGPTGLVTTLRPGVTVLGVSIDGVRGTGPTLRVHPPATALVLEAGPTPLEVGSLATVRVVARDASGAEVAGVPVSVGTSDYAVLSTWGRGPSVTPVELRMMAWRRGHADVWAVSHHVRPTHQLIAPGVPLGVVDDGTPPDTLRRRTSDPTVRIEVGRAMLRTGDTTTVRLVYVNRSGVRQRFETSAGCELQFNVHDGAGRYASSPPGAACGAPITVTIAPGDSLVRQRTWRAVDDVLGGGVPMAPGLYYIRALGVGNPSFLAIGAEVLMVRVLL